MAVAWLALSGLLRADHDFLWLTFFIGLADVGQLAAPHLVGQDIAFLGVGFDDPQPSDIRCDAEARPAADGAASALHGFRSLHAEVDHVAPWRTN